MAGKVQDILIITHALLALSKRAYNWEIQRALCRLGRDLFAYIQLNEAGRLPAHVHYSILR
jgi:hypothetical protein